MTNTSQQITYGREKKLSKPRKQNIKKLVISEKNKEKIKDQITIDIWKYFETEKKRSKKKTRTL